MITPLVLSLHCILISLNFSGYCIITLVVSIILCQYQFALFDINYLSGHCV